NGVTETQRGSIYEDVQQPGAEVIREWVPDDPDGQLFKIERWFEFSDAGSRIADPMPTLQLFATTDLATGQPTKKLARYRWCWLPRVVQDSANDYTNLFALADAVNAASPEPYTSQTEGLVDIEQWMGIFAIEHVFNNFDSYGHIIGKNMYAYKPVQGKWQMHMFDIDWVMLASIGFGLNTNAPLFDCNDPTITRMYNHPPFRRAYFRTVKKAVDGPLAAANANPWLDAKYAALQADGVTRSAGQNLSSPATLKTWIQGRRNYLLQQLATIAANFTITSNNGNDFTANTNVVTLAGTAPVEVKGLRVNGADYLVTWTDVTTWSIRLLLASGQNGFTLQGFDSAGNALTNLADSINITFAGAVESPVGRVIVNEIMYNPVIPDAEFVEIHNQSPATAFDLSGWRLNGVDFTFPAGTIIDPGAYLVVTKDRSAFIAAYGINPQVVGEFAGQLDNGGETLSLIRPGATPDQDQVIDAVTYDDDPPWLATADGTGSSLQLIDPAQENFRVANWSVMTVNTNTNAAPQWQYVALTGTATTSRLYVYMTSAGDVYIDDLKLVAGSTPEAGLNQINNGDFESAFPGPWTVSANLGGSAVSSAVKHSGSGSLHIVSTSAGSSLGSSIWQDTGPLVTNATYSLSYWYLPSTNGSGLTIRLSGNGINSAHSIAPAQSPSSLATPGGPNSVRTTLPAFPPLWLNEIQANNITGVA
ncbi:MAG TPA: CotH kinase family protein, partial [Verrucomicrobiae bacterium]|nr:CotH kinase family protein [Verrucomicrobiae bacterium]